MPDVDAMEVVELFPFAASRVVTCEVVVGINTHTPAR